MKELEFTLGELAYQENVLKCHNEGSRYSLSCKWTIKNFNRSRFTQEFVSKAFSVPGTNIRFTLSLMFKGFYNESKLRVNFNTPEWIVSHIFKASFVDESLDICRHSGVGSRFKKIEGSNELQVCVNPQEIYLENDTAILVCHIGFQIAESSPANGVFKKIEIN